LRAQEVNEGRFQFEKWLPLVEAFRTLLISPDGDLIALLNAGEQAFTSL
jgi:hypothetical protein